MQRVGTVKKTVAAKPRVAIKPIEAITEKPGEEKKEPKVFDPMAKPEPKVDKKVEVKEEKVEVKEEKVEPKTEVKMDDTMMMMMQMLAHRDQFADFMAKLGMANVVEDVKAAADTVKEEVKEIVEDIKEAVEDIVEGDDGKVFDAEEGPDAAVDKEELADESEAVEVVEEVVEDAAEEDVVEEVMPEKPGLELMYKFLKDIFCTYNQMKKFKDGDRIILAPNQLSLLIATLYDVPVGAVRVLCEKKPVKKYSDGKVFKIYKVLVETEEVKGEAPLEVLKDYCVSLRYINFSERLMAIQYV